MVARLKLKEIDGKAQFRGASDLTDSQGAGGLPPCTPARPLKWGDADGASRPLPSATGLEHGPGVHRSDGGWWPWPLII